jgi:hypothetical protein
VSLEEEGPFNCRKAFENPMLRAFRFDRVTSIAAIHDACIAGPQGSDIAGPQGSDIAGPSVHVLHIPEMPVRKVDFLDLVMQGRTILHFHIFGHWIEQPV